MLRIEELALEKAKECYANGLAQELAEKIVNDFTKDYIEKHASGIDWITKDIIFSTTLYVTDLTIKEVYRQVKENKS